jgi:dolichol-phosphate mannosyltransferase
VRALVVLPTYNEVENLDEVLTRTRAAAAAVDVLVVDDGSPDGTAAMADDLAVRLGGVHVLRRATKSGLGAAYRAGFAWGREHGYDVLLEMDADLSHDPAVLPVLLAGIAMGADLVIGSRYVPGGAIPNWGVHRLLLSKAGNRYADAALRLGVRDCTSGFRAYRASIVEEIDVASVQAEGYGFQIEMTYRVRRAGGTIGEVPISFTDRVRGESKMSGRIVIEAMVLVTRWAVRDRLRALTGRPGRRSSVIGAR